MWQRIAGRCGWVGFAAFLSVTMASPAMGAIEELTGEVVDVTDGDCIWMLNEGQKVEVRLTGIDAPDEGQAFFEVARQGLAHALLGKVVTVRDVGRDAESRLSGRVYLGELDINLELVKAGLAWHDRQESSDKVLSEAQKAARKAKVGLWQQRLRPVPPWQFRLARQEKKEEREVDQLGYTVKPDQ